jgi:hypothetical protein
MTRETRRHFAGELRTVINRQYEVAAAENMLVDFELQPDRLAVRVTGNSKQGGEAYVSHIPWAQLESDDEFPLNVAIAAAVEKGMAKVKQIVAEQR